ncbi:YifB family Mg chelatase-like AAA ATPase [Chitinophaga qingshengii]|uniref:YifB family Mg chelatase-like AAA ATPase n=1 Tax=Chitinophaga qingshengii TaxID=1569794 RepID=A0ABR7TK93_9BACT|nr:YifB family Mg chelatase-like AAA ATPase [Chitinophaga qingshengii]MBC9930874.1 YifB family Mg chelatase-like AAA ATPase [Chitinophaga qingshengii]
MIVKTFGSAIYGVDAITITIEVNVSSQGTRFYMVGLPDSAVKESERRIESAISHLGFRMPRTRTVVNMAPAAIRKAGAAYDLPIAIGILGASGKIPADSFDRYLLMGELSLDGSLLPIRGALSIAIQAQQEGFRGFILPTVNAHEAAMVAPLEVYGVTHLSEVLQFFHQPESLTPIASTPPTQLQGNFDLDFSDVKGQYNIKRALEIAAAGGHNAILIGPPGAGKTMLAQRFPTILPPLTLAEALETTKIYSVAGKLPQHASLVLKRPFRSPHHTISDTALVGGGSYPQPGEISLAHNGVLFLDELPEFKRQVLEVMRQPLEERRVTISRARSAVDFPAGFMLLASMNPCPCGYFNHPDKDCSCTPAMVQKYLNRVSGPLLDRIDLHVEVTPVSFSDLTGNREEEKSTYIRERVMAARAIQAERYAALPGIYCNAQVGSQQLKRYCSLNDNCRQLLKNAIQQLKLSARAYDRILKVSRTIADLAQCQSIEVAHMAEAIQYRSLDREGWM